LAEQIRHGQETIARARPWIERLDDMLAELDPPGEWVLARERVSFRPVLVDGALVDWWPSLAAAPCQAPG
jgi:hypothetical protein